MKKKKNLKEYYTIKLYDIFDFKTFSEFVL